MFRFIYSSRERQSQQQRSFRIRKTDPRRKSADFTPSFVNHHHHQQRQMIEKPPDPGQLQLGSRSDVVDGKMLSKSARVLQEHVTDRNKTNLSSSAHHVTGSKPSSVGGGGGGGGYKENLVIHNYNSNEQLICDRNTGITYVKGRLLGKVRTSSLSDIKNTEGMNSTLYYGHADVIIITVWNVRFLYEIIGLIVLWCRILYYLKPT